MIRNETTTQLDSIEELTLHSLSCTLPGLEELIQESHDCAAELEKGSSEGLRRFSDLAEKLHDFDVFRGDIMSLFNIDPKVIGDASGDMQECEWRLRSSLDAMPQLLDQRDVRGLAALLQMETTDLTSNAPEILVLPATVTAAPTYNALFSVAD